MTDDTIFHKIIRKEIPAEIVYEDDDVIAFHDIHPKAPLHLLFVPKQFTASVADDDQSLSGMLIEKAKQFANQKGITGYKLTYHVGPDGGQEIMYLHLHFMSKQALD